ncbi:putative metal-binding motif-containing protein, partial [Thermoproteota archaeon]
TPCNQFYICFGQFSFSSTVCFGGECIGNDQCICDEYHQGTTCSTERQCYSTYATDPDVCSGNGECQPDGTCVCDYAYGGDKCDYRIDYCDGYLASDLTHVCSGKGNCSDDGTETWVCECDTGWNGATCSMPSICNGVWDPDACNGVHGDCISDNICQCKYPYTGTWCADLVTCNSILATDIDNVCSGFGLCYEQDKCACDDDHTGTWCADKITCSGLPYDDPNVCGGVQICTKNESITRCIPDPMNDSCVSFDDSDGDGYDSGVDCDDANASIYPGADDSSCNNVDEDCDGTDDDDYNSTQTTCGIGPCAATGTTSCIFGGIVNSCTPGTPVPEVCNGIDDDCNGDIDNGIAQIPTICGIGECIATGTTFCANGTLNDSCIPGTPVSETCNGIDDDCDGDIDNNITSILTTCGIGACAATGTTSCIFGGIVNSCTPGTPVPEVCNGIDDDCNGDIDNGVKTTFYLDFDGDSYGDNDTTIQNCSVPVNYTLNNTDCNDNNSAINPNATEVCNYVDDDCDREVDENVTITYYLDFDGDGFGDINSTVQDCSVPANYTLNNTDCNDNNSAVCPNATEVCGNGIDEDCTGADKKCKSGGGGGGGGGSDAPAVCYESWECGDWSSCTANKQTRSCTDEADCGTSENKPSSSRVCVPDDWESPEPPEYDDGSTRGAGSEPTEGETSGEAGLAGSTGGNTGSAGNQLTGMAVADNEGSAGAVNWQAWLFVLIALILLGLLAFLLKKKK